MTSFFTLRRAAVAASVAYIPYSLDKKRTLPEKFVVELDLSSTTLVEKGTSLRERVASSLQGGGQRETLLLRDATAAIRDAADDPRVAGLVANVSASALSLAQTQELSAAIDVFNAKKAPLDLKYARKTGATGPSFAYAAEFQDTKQYLLASAFGAVYQQPGASLRLPGVSMDVPYVAGWLRKWGLRFEAVSAGTYKSGYAPLSDTTPSRAHQNATQSMLASSFAQIVREIARGRGLSEKEVRRLASRGGWLGSAEATKAKLLDGALYVDEFDALVAKECGDVSVRHSLTRYREARSLQRSLDAATDRVRVLSAVLSAEMGTLAQEGAKSAAAYGQKAAAAASDASASATTYGAAAAAAVADGASAAMSTVRKGSATVQPRLEAWMSAMGAVMRGDGAERERMEAQAASAAKAAAQAAADKAAAELLAAAEAAAALAARKRAWLWPSKPTEADVEAAAAAITAAKVAEETTAIKAAAEAAAKAAAEAAAAEAAAKAKAKADKAAAAKAKAEARAEAKAARAAAKAQAAAMGSDANGLWSRLGSRLQASARPKVGLITLQGQIIPQAMDSGKGPARAGQISAREARDLLKAAREDPTLKALVLRIDTRGGEANASEAIWREVRLMMMMMMMMMMMRSGARCD